PDPNNAAVWTAVPGLTFSTPKHSGLTVALDGNAAANRTLLTNALTGVTVGPNEELFLRWVDINDGNNDHAVAVDDLNVSWSVVAANTNKPSVTQQAVNKTVTVSARATFQIQATGQTPLSYQWYLTNSPDA